jgi:hypothetical protein
MNAISIRAKSRRVLVKTQRFARNFQIKSAFAGGSQSHLSSIAAAYAHLGRGLLSKMKPIIISKNGQNNATRSFVVMPQGGTHEASQTLALIGGNTPNYFAPRMAWLGLGFREKAVIVEVMQTKKENSTQLNTFRRMTGKQALNFMLQELERRAREVGFEEVRIRSPETLFAFQFPIKSKNSTLTDKQIRAQMKILYARVAKAEGYVREKFYYVKRLV